MAAKKAELKILIPVIERSLRDEEHGSPPAAPSPFPPVTSPTPVPLSSPLSSTRRARAGAGSESGAQAFTSPVSGAGHGSGGGFGSPALQLTTPSPSKEVLKRQLARTEREMNCMMEKLRLMHLKWSKPK